LYLFLIALTGTKLTENFFISYTASLPYTCLGEEEEEEEGKIDCMIDHTRHQSILPSSSSS
jgi:hypothetical protein